VKRSKVLKQNRGVRSVILSPALSTIWKWNFEVKPALKAAEEISPTT
jgi:hypothetical protein